jgi:predicted amidophosphoribosyltransferase
MGVFARDPRKDQEQPGGGSGLSLDLDLQVCPACRRELHPWERVCPDDGSQAVPRTSLQRADLPPPPPHLLADPDPEDE